MVVALTPFIADCHRVLRRPSVPWTHTSPPPSARRHLDRFSRVIDVRSVVVARWRQSDCHRVLGRACVELGAGSVTSPATATSTFCSLQRPRADSSAGNSVSYSTTTTRVCTSVHLKTWFHAQLLRATRCIIADIPTCWKVCNISQEIGWQERLQHDPFCVPE